jgi:8-oxo-dGTP diphosphatase
MTRTAEKHLVYCWIERDGAVLFLRRHPAIFLGGRWELPGGTVEPGERPVPAVVREVGEETGLAVRVTRQRSAHSWMDVMGIDLRIHARIYEAVELGRADVVLNADEHVEYAWLTREQAAALGLAPHFAETLALGPASG